MHKQFKNKRKFSFRTNIVFGTENPGVKLDFTPDLYSINLWCICEEQKKYAPFVMNSNDKGC